MTAGRSILVRAALGRAARERRVPPTLGALLAVSALVSCDPRNSLSGLVTYQVGFGDYTKIASGEYSALRTGYAEGHVLIFARNEDDEEVVFALSSLDDVYERRDQGGLIPCSLGTLAGPPLEWTDLFFSQTASGSDTRSGLRAFVFRDFDATVQRGTLKLVGMDCATLSEEIPGARTPIPVGPWFFTDTERGDVLAVSGITGDVVVLGTAGRLVDVSEPRSLSIVDGATEWASEVVVQDGELLRIYEVTSDAPDELTLLSELGPNVGAVRIGPKSLGGVVVHDVVLELDGDVLWLLGWPRSEQTVADVTIQRAADACLVPSHPEYARTSLVPVVRSPCDGGTVHVLGREERTLPSTTAFFTHTPVAQLAAEGPRGTPSRWWHVRADDRVVIADDVVDVHDVSTSRWAFFTAGSAPDRVDLLDWDPETGTGEIALYDVVANGPWFIGTPDARAWSPVADAYRRWDSSPELPDETLRYERVATDVWREDVDLDGARGLAFRGLAFRGVEAWFENGDGIAGDLRFRYTDSEDAGWFSGFARGVPPHGLRFLLPTLEQGGWPRGALLIHDYDSERRAGTLNVLDADRERYEEPTVTNVRDLEPLFEDVIFSRVGDEEPGLYYLNIVDLTRGPWVD